MKLTPSQLTSLRWYANRVNHGRGRICGDTNTLRRLGLIRLEWTGAKTWVLSITAKGTQMLEEVSCTSTD